MKKRIVTLFFIMVLLQTGVAQKSRFGFVGGSIYSQSNLKDQNISGERATTRSTTPGFRDPIGWSNINYSGIFSGFGGIVYDIKITNEFSIKSKLVLVKKGWQERADTKIDTFVSISSFLGSALFPTINIPNEHTVSNQTYKFTYLEIPVNFTFYAPVRRSLLTLGVGAYASWGISGNYKYQIVESNKISLDSSKSGAISFVGNKPGAIYNARRFDYGATIEAGLEFRNRLCINLTYTAGIANVIEEHYWALPNRHRDLRLSLGYYLKEKQRNMY